MTQMFLVQYYNWALGGKYYKNTFKKGNKQVCFEKVLKAWASRMQCDKSAVKVERAERCKCERISEGGISIEEGLVIL